jgi:glycosyltransferase involved in cell wall biosynthesis
METLLVEFARHAERKCFDLQFISLSTRGRLADDIEVLGWPVTCLEEPPGLGLATIWRLARLFRFWRPAIVHTHNTKPLIVAAPAARLARVPRIIHTRHGQRFRASSGQTALFRIGARLSDRFVCVSQDCTRISLKEKISGKKLTTIQNGIDLARFDFAGAKAGGPAIMVGRLSPEKDVETLVRAVPLIIREHPGFHLEIAGSGPCLLTLGRLAQELRISDRIHFLGEIQDIPALLASASLFVLPSLTEGISLTLLEAMARGLPVVATNVGGNPEVVVHGETGLLVPTKSPVDLAAAVLRICRDPERGRQMGRAGRRRVELNFDVRRMVAAYETLYLNLLRNGDAPAQFPKKRAGEQSRTSLGLSGYEGAVRFSSLSHH